MGEASISFWLSTAALSIILRIWQEGPVALFPLSRWRAIARKPTGFCSTASTGLEGTRPASSLRPPGPVPSCSGSTRYGNTTFSSTPMVPSMGNGPEAGQHCDLVRNEPVAWQRLRVHAQQRSGCQELLRARQGSVQTASIRRNHRGSAEEGQAVRVRKLRRLPAAAGSEQDRKSTRLNSS